MSPPIYRWYKRLGWRIPLWHLFPFVAWVSIVCLFGTAHMRARHSVDRMYWLYDHGYFGSSEKPTEAQLANIDYTSWFGIAFELAFLSFIPVLVVAVISYIVTKRIAGGDRESAA